MSDDLVFTRFIFVFLKEIRRSGKCDLVNVLFYFIFRHTKSIVHKTDRLVLSIDKYFHFLFVILRKGCLPDHLQFFEFCDGITSIADKFTDENVVIRIQPFFNNRKNIIRINC